MWDETKAEFREKIVALNVYEKIKTTKRVKSMSKLLRYKAGKQKQNKL